MFVKQLATIATTGMLLASTMVPAAFADTNVGVFGNGFDSSNSVSVHNNSTNTLRQTNTATIQNSVTTNNNTGGNRSDFNTGGNSSINTGNANSFVSISNTANSNDAVTMGSCNCSNGNTSVGVSGNGAFSNTRVAVNTNQENQAFQNNNAQFTNRVNLNNTTGNNSTSGNTGGNTNFWPWGQNQWNMGNGNLWMNPWNQNGNNGQTSIQTGSANSTVYLDNMANMNSFGH